MKPPYEKRIGDIITDQITAEQIAEVDVEELVKQAMNASKLRRNNLYGSSPLEVLDLNCRAASIVFKSEKDDDGNITVAKDVDLAVPDDWELSDGSDASTVSLGPDVTQWSLTGSQGSTEGIEYDETKPSGPVIETCECTVCGAKRPYRAGALQFGTPPRSPASIEIECFGECGEETLHLWIAQDWDVFRYEFECPECGDESIKYDCPTLEITPEGSDEPELPECHDCSGVSEGPDVLPIVARDAESKSVIGAEIMGKEARDYDEMIDELTSISGVDRSTADALIGAGYYSKEQIDAVGRKEIGDVRGISGKLAPRISYNVSGASITRLRVTDVVFEDDVDS